MRGAALPTEQQGPFPGSAGEGARALAAADREAIRLCHGLAGRLFPWDLTRSLELALLKAFCVPSISGLLAQTGEFLQRPRKRYDDTGLMVAELLRHGPDSPAGEAVISRLNRIHGAYPIRDDDYRYVLSTFVCEPIRWLARYGWRPLSAAEQEAIYRFWRLVGERMGIPEIPPDLPAMLAFNQEFEAEVFAAAASNRQVADATLEMLLRDWPAPLRPGLGRLLAGLLSRSEAHCLGWSRPASPLQGLLLAALRQRGVEIATVTLHVGLGTFRPLEREDLRGLELHSEWVEVSEALVRAVAACRQRGGRLIAVGTTSVRSLEGVAALHGGELVPHTGPVNLVIQPGFRFAVVQGLLTNFHLPRSSLLLLVAALIGRSRLLDLYAEAIEQRYRFFSYGDAMWIAPSAISG